MSRPNLGIGVDQFFAEYWQRRPLLARGAIDVADFPLTADHLAGLACEPEVESRIIRGSGDDAWDLRPGPFQESDFADLPDRHWTLLVQDVEKWLPEVHGVLDLFGFVPAWRIDDIMLSFAVPGGSAGPHVDQYDVFLVQVSGRRRWSIDQRPEPDLSSRPDQDLDLLRIFDPSDCWELEPGDLLYLPPGIPHHGVALTDCMTCSVGMRAPSEAEMLLDFAASVAETLDESRRFRDPGRSPAKSAGAIPDEDIARAAASIRRLADCPESRIAAWFGRFITRYRLAGDPDPGDAWSADSVRTLLAASDSSLVRNPWTRWATLHDGGASWLFVNGEQFAVPAPLATLLADQRKPDLQALRRMPGAPDLLARLLESGYLEVEAGGCPDRLS